MKHRHHLLRAAVLVASAALAGSPVLAGPRPTPRPSPAAASGSGVTFRGLTGADRILPNNPPDDAALAGLVRDALAADPYTRDLGVGVRVDRGVAYLSKTVDTPFHRARAELVVARVPNIVDVVSTIGVSQPIGYSDGELLAAVRSEIYWNPLLNVHAVQISVQHGQITLRGTVGSDRIRGALVDEAASTGAGAVLDRLTVVEPAAPVSATTN